MLYGFGGDASGGYGSGGEADGEVSEFGGFFSKPRAKGIDIVSEGVYYSDIIDKKAPETVPFALGGGRTFAADFFCIRETRGERIMFFDFWEDAKENMVQAGKERMRKLVLKYGDKPDEDDMNEADWFEYQAVKKYEDEVTGEMIKDKIKNGIVSSIFPVGLASYKTAKAFGEFVADTQIAYKYKRAMDETGGKLVRKYGSGQGAEIDNYYHSLLQCELAKISQESQRNGILLGYAKEVADYVKKRSNEQNRKVILEDSRKDLQNNMYGSKLGERNKNKPCEWLLDDKRTRRMRDAGIR